MNEKLITKWLQKKKWYYIKTRVRWIKDACFDDAKICIES